MPHHSDYDHDHQHNPFLEQVGKLPDYYRALGVSRKATGDEIDKAFRKLSLKFHPDKNPSNAKAAEEFKKISNYREVLRDLQQRALYDAALAEQEGGGSRSYKPTTPGAQGGYSSHRRPEPRPQDYQRDSNQGGWGHRRRSSGRARPNQKRNSRSGYNYGSRNDSWSHEHPFNDWYDWSDGFPSGCNHTPPSSSPPPGSPQSPSGSPRGYGSDGGGYSPGSPPGSPREHSQPRAAPKPEYRSGIDSITITCGPIQVGIEENVLRRELPNLALQLPSHSNKLSLDSKTYTPCLLVRLMAYARGNGFIDNHGLGSVSAKYRDVDDPYYSVGQNSVAAAKLYVKLYGLAQKLGMSARTMQAIRQKYIKAWHWKLSPAPTTWTKPQLVGDDNQRRATLTDSKCQLARFVYAHAPSGDHALLDPVIRTMQIEITSRDDLSRLDLPPILQLVNENQQLALDLATIRLGDKVGCGKCGVSKQALRIPCSCGKFKCARESCARMRKGRWFCVACGDVGLSQY